MLLNEENFYIIKQSNGNLCNLTYDENKGIIYKLFEQGVWSDYKVIASNGTRMFSSGLFQNDGIYVLYQDVKGNINLSNYREKQWSEQQILKNEDNDLFNIYFKTIVSENQVYVIYSILNKITGFAKIFYQTLDEKNNLSSPEIIDEIKYDYKNPFSIYVEDKKEIFIVYQSLIDNHKLVYKSFNLENKRWSKLYIIDSASYPYRDYSALILNGKLHILYLRDDHNKISLIYAQSSNDNIKRNILRKDASIDSCTLFILYNQIWCSWIEYNKIYSSFSINNGNTFSTPPYYEVLNSLNIIKAEYISNNSVEKKYSALTNIYVTKDSDLEYDVFSNIYVDANGINSNVLSYIVYFNDKVFEKILFYEDKLKQQDQYINEIKLSYVRKSEEIDEEYGKFREGKQLLNENINFLQNSLISKEERINQLENINIERENQILCLKEENEKLNENIKSLEKNLNIEIQKINELENINIEKENQLLYEKEKIENLNKQIEELRTELNRANQKLNNSFLKRIFGE